MRTEKNGVELVRLFFPIMNVAAAMLVVVTSTLENNAANTELAAE